MRVVALALGAVLLASAPAAAAVERFAVLIGNDAGARDEITLRFAEADAVKLRDVLVDLGGFRPENIVMLEGQSAETARRAIVAVNDRIRALPAGQDAILLVYYSGHADATALHLGESELQLGVMEQLVRESPAGVRLLVVDACRSGALTRVKGGIRTSGFDIQVDERLAAQGAVFLTSSAANEDAQESDELGGSFFTHYLVSGLLGTADSNGDGQVSLAEAYGHAYASTLRASSRTLGGIQHPTFRYSLSGRGDVILTSIAGARGRRGTLHFPAERTYLVMRDGPDGAVVGEIGARDRRRRLSVRPGRYFVRARARATLLEGTVRVDAGAERAVEDSELTRTAYARLVRKGGELDRVHGPQIGWRGRNAITPGDLCVGGMVGYLFEMREVDMGARLANCRSDSDDDAVSGRVDEVELDLRAGRTFDLGSFSLGPVVAVGGGLFRQRLEMDAPSRAASFAHLGAGLVVAHDMAGAAYWAIDAMASALFYRERPEGVARPGLGISVTFLVGWRIFH
ncbi:MAG TPA: caspase family protein [Kofleriaceae bacterium]|nr:caspase family protein [Kofleriaceae bacterium]